MSNWNYEDFLHRLEAIKGIEFKQVPGLAQILDAVGFRIEELDRVEQILRSMTQQERLNPNLLQGEEGQVRRDRIAQDAESTREAVDSLIDQFQRLPTIP